MKQKIIISAALVILVVAFSFFLLRKETEPTGFETQPSEEIILYFGEGCQHCAVVEKFISENEVEEKIAFSRKEIYKNPDNARELEEKAEICGLPKNTIGVPFLWDGERCYMGDREIIEFFTENMHKD